MEGPGKRRKKVEGYITAKSAQRDFPCGVGVEVQSGRMAGLVLVVPLTADHGGVVRPMKRALHGDPDVFNARAN